MSEIRPSFSLKGSRMSEIRPSFALKGSRMSEIRSSFALKGSQMNEVRACFTLTGTQRMFDRVRIRVTRAFFRANQPSLGATDMTTNDTDPPPSRGGQAPSENAAPIDVAFGIGPRRRES